MASPDSPHSDEATGAATAAAAQRVTWITGGGSGIGAASALALAESGHAVAISGRREAELEAVAADLRSAGHRVIAVPADVSDDASVQAAVARIRSELGPITDLLCAAGTNAPNRTWADSDATTFARIIDVNLVATARTVHAVLPAMREAGFGQVTLISSWSAWMHHPGAGVAYSASKRGLSTLALMLNEQEMDHGIRACVICPADVNTEFLRQRPTQPDAETRSKMLDPGDVARAVRFVADSPAAVTVNELVISPTVNLAIRKPV